MTANTRPQISPGAAFLRLALLSCAATGVALAVGYWPTRAVAGPGGAVAMCAGVGIALVAALAGLVPPLLALGKGPKEQFAGLVTGMAIRFLLTLGLLVAGLFSSAAARLSLALWVVIGYLVLIVVDTAGVVWVSRPPARAST